jgi:enoyl-CoA hydratase
MYENLLYEVRDSIAFVTVNRPKVRNALNAQTVAELMAAFGEAGDDKSVRVVILTGDGEKAFVSGADINELAVQTPVEGRQYSMNGQETFDFIEELGKPVIAAVNGYALGGGCELAMACTFRVASDNAVFGQPEVKLGLIPGYGGSQRLPRLVGKGRAMQILLTGGMVKADEAYRIGLANEVVPQAELAGTVESLAKKIIANAPLAVQFCLEAVNRGVEMTQSDGQFLEATLFGLCCATEDMKEGTRAFLEKRATDFKGK